MYYSIIIMFIYFLVVSCNPSHKHDLENRNNKSDTSKIVKDTFITYDIEGISSEGVECNAKYVNGKIIKLNTCIYGETGKIIIIYEFETARIKVLEIRYSYKTRLENVKSKGDMSIEREVCYYIDFKGNIIGQPIVDIIDIFQEIKAKVSFELN